MNIYKPHKPERKSQQISIKLTETEWCILDDAAKEHKCTQSEFLRWLIKWFQKRDNEEQTDKKGQQ